MLERDNSSSDKELLFNNTFIIILCKFSILSELSLRANPGDPSLRLYRKLIFS